MELWKEDTLGQHMLKVLVIVSIGAGLWGLVDPAMPSIEVQLGLLAAFFVVLLAGLACEHVLSWRAYERGER